MTERQCKICEVLTDLLSVKEEADAVRAALVDVEIVRLIRKLTEEEGSMICIPCPNPDFGGPAMFVELGQGFKHARRYYGESLLDCLRKAAEAS